MGHRYGSKQCANFGRLRGVGRVRQDKAMALPRHNMLSAHRFSGQRLALAAIRQCHEVLGARVCAAFDGTGFHARRLKASSG